MNCKVCGAVTGGTYMRDLSYAISLNGQFIAVTDCKHDLFGHYRRSSKYLPYHDTFRQCSRNCCGPEEYILASELIYNEGLHKMRVHRG